MRTRASHEEAAGPYVSTPSGIVYRRPTQNGPVDQLLSNFTARIVEEVIADDGASERAELAIEGELGGEPLAPIRVPTRRFSSLDWVNREWGARPIITAGMGNRDRLREGIQRLSPDIERRHVFEHSGWRKLPGMAGATSMPVGRLGRWGRFRASTWRCAARRHGSLFPDPPSGDDTARRPSAPACPCSIWRPMPSRSRCWARSIARCCASSCRPTCRSSWSVRRACSSRSWPRSPCSTIGAGFDRLHLPAHWSATANFLERAAFDFKDAPLVIDDFAPAGSQIEVARLHATADRVFRGAGNRGGRGRMNADGSLRPDYPPRGSSSARARMPRAASRSRSRMMILEVAPGDVRRDCSTAAQDAGRRGVFVGRIGPDLSSTSPASSMPSRVSLPAQLGELPGSGLPGCCPCPDAGCRGAPGGRLVGLPALRGCRGSGDTRRRHRRRLSACGRRWARRRSGRPAIRPARSRRGASSICWARRWPVDSRTSPHPKAARRFPC